MNSSFLHSKSPPQNILIKNLLLSHDPDGRRLDSEQLLQAMENIMLYATLSEVLDQHFDFNSEREVTSIETVQLGEPVTHTIQKISFEMICTFSTEGILHERTMLLFDFLANYRWEDKAVLALASFAKSYAEFWLLIQLYPGNPVAAAVTMLKQLPSDLSTFKRRFKALSLLMKTVVDLTKCVIKFESLPLSQVKLENEAKSMRELHIYSAVYWIIRSILICSSQIVDLGVQKPQQVHVPSLKSLLLLSILCHIIDSKTWFECLAVQLMDEVLDYFFFKYSDSTTVATWELSSLVRQLKVMCSQLKEHTEKKLFQELLNIFEEVHNDNQEVLRVLLALTDDFPLIDCSSQEKIGLGELKKKVVILLITKPGFLSIEESLFLIQQTYDNPNNKTLEESYEIVWIPISESDSWTIAEKRSFRYLSHYLPWCSVKHPWLLNSAAVNFFKKEWSYTDSPLMVVLDPQGKVSNKNAMDMVFLWGPRAYPFSDLREQELWKEQWNLQFLVDEIDPLLTKWAHDDIHLCIYGSDNKDWILELNSKMKEMTENTGVKIEMVYVGKRKPRERRMKNILDIVEDAKYLTSSLSLTKMQFFWLRMESIIRLMNLQQGHTAATNYNLVREVSNVVHMDENDKDWALIGRGSSKAIVGVEGTKLMECMKNFGMWEKNVGKLGFPVALRTALEPPIGDEPCGHSKLVSKDDEKQTEEIEFCEKCRRPMEKFAVYKFKPSLAEA